jgi:hypothetical protein
MVRCRWPILLLFFCASCSFRDADVGSGPITLSPQVEASFDFVVTESGVGSHYLYCEGGFNCQVPEARMQALAQCRRHYPGEECKLYAIGRVVVWQDADAPRARRQLSESDRLVRECLEGETPEMRIDRCSQAIASSKLAPTEKRGAYYVRGRAYEQVGRIVEAEQDYSAVLAIDPDHAAATARLDNLRVPAAGPGLIPPETE